jgi:hypothetical protein
MCAKYSGYGVMTAPPSSRLAAQLQVLNCVAQHQLHRGVHAAALDYGDTYATGDLDALVVANLLDGLVELHDLIEQLTRGEHADSSDLCLHHDAVCYKRIPCNRCRDHPEPGFPPEAKLGLGGPADEEFDGQAGEHDLCSRFGPQKRHVSPKLNIHIAIFHREYFLFLGPPKQFVGIPITRSDARPCPCTKRAENFS